MRIFSACFLVSKFCDFRCKVQQIGCTYAGSTEGTLDIFISYRRSDASAAAGRIRDHLVSKFGDRSVFMDVSTIEGGDFFEREILHNLRLCKVVVPIIGPGWLRAIDSESRLRLEQHGDWVREELLEAMRTQRPIIPVFVDGASAFSIDQLPRGLGFLAAIQGISVRHDTFDDDVKKLIEVIQKKTQAGILGVTNTRELTAYEQRVRQLYLYNFKEDILNRLASSIHSAHKIDLGIVDAPKATALPWKYRDSSRLEQFDTIEEAIDKYRGRLLILGAPGSGKTTTILHMGQQFAAAAEADDSAPIPLFVNLTKFRFQKSNRSLFSNFRNSYDGELIAGQEDRQFENWLIKQLSQMPGLSSKQARKWIEEGRIALLLDGLDEVDDQLRAKLTTLLNNTFLRHYPASTVIICSRINEYLPLQENDVARLQLNGAITLQPLSTEQINHYLKSVNAFGLIAALPDDKVLQEMAQTPLTLSIMTLAYGSSSPEPAMASESLTERRLNLMASYVDRMLQRKERRDADIQWDQNPDNDVPLGRYRYSPETVKTWLSWLAIRMSVRMQTTLPMNRFTEFLEDGSEKDKFAIRYWLALVYGIVMLLTTAVCGFISAENIATQWPIVIAITMFGGLSAMTATLAHKSEVKTEVRASRDTGVMLFSRAFSSVQVVT